MPARNIVKQFESDSYYHIYNRGVAKQRIFVDPTDKRQFISILSRHLDEANQTFKSDGVAYRKFNRELEILSYCLMGNHFHLLVYQLQNPQAITDFMRCVLTAYTMYFNHRYKRVGPLFQSIYKSSRISNDGYLLHISRYIHLNPRTYRTYQYSSLAQYLGESSPAWLKPQRILDLFEGDSYMVFLEDYKDRKLVLEAIKSELANVT